MSLRSDRLAAKLTQLVFSERSNYFRMFFHKWQFSTPLPFYATVFEACHLNLNQFVVKVRESRLPFDPTSSFLLLVAIGCCSCCCRFFSRNLLIVPRFSMQLPPQKTYSKWNSRFPPKTFADWGAYFDLCRPSLKNFTNSPRTLQHHRSFWPAAVLGQWLGWTPSGYKSGCTSTQKGYNPSCQLPIDNAIYRA